MVARANAGPIFPTACKSGLTSERLRCCISTLSLFPSCTQAFTKYSGKTQCTVTVLVQCSTLKSISAPHQLQSEIRNNQLLMVWMAASAFGTLLYDNMLSVMEAFLCVSPSIPCHDLAVFPYLLLMLQRWNGSGESQTHFFFVPAVLKDPLLLINFAAVCKSENVVHIGCFIQ